MTFVIHYEWLITFLAKYHSEIAKYLTEYKTNIRENNDKDALHAIQLDVIYLLSLGI